MQQVRPQRTRLPCLLGQASRLRQRDATSDKPMQLSYYFKMRKAMPATKKVAGCLVTSKVTAACS